jgi:hypothetical protein
MSSPYQSTSTSPSTSFKASDASAPSSRAPTRSSDPYYGHEETSALCTRFITSLFQCSNIPTATAPGTPQPTLTHFVAYALYRTRLPSIVTFAALQLLQRLKTRFPAARGSSGHRLFISAFMIASKVICDDTYSNQSWGIVAQKMFTLKEINQMERELCGFLEWNLNVQGEEAIEFEARVRAEHGPKAVSGAPSSSASSETPLDVPTANAYPTPEITPDPCRPIRPDPSPYKVEPTYQAQAAAQSSQISFPSPISPQQFLHAHSPQPPRFRFASANSSLVSSPESDDCKTPSPVAMTAPRCLPPKGEVSSHSTFDFRARQHVSNLHFYPVNIGIW